MQLPLSFSICSKDFMKCLHIELYSGSKRKFTKITILYLNIYKALTLQLQEEPFHFLNKVFKYVQISGGFYMVR